MRKVIFMVGAPASGKSTLARHIQALATPEGALGQDCVPILSLDTFRHLMCPTHIDTHGKKVFVSGANRKEYIEAYHASVEAHMRVGATLILDNTHTVWRNIRQAYECAELYDYEPIFCRVNAPREELVARDAMRVGSQVVGSEVIDHMLLQMASLQLPPDATVIDVDTTDVRDGIDPLMAAAESIVSEHLADDVECADVDYRNQPLVIVGDVHGNAARLAKLAKDLRACEVKPHVVFVGDLLDRGTDACTTMLTLRDLRREFDVTFVEGNHDWHMRRILAGDKRAEERFGETAKTYDELASNPSVDTLSEMRDIISKMVCAAVVRTQDTTYVVTHAGIQADLAARIADTGRIPPHTTIADFVHGCGVRNQLYTKSHPSSYDAPSIMAAHGRERDMTHDRVVQVHGHRECDPALIENDNHLDLESRVWTPDGCLTTLWVDGGHETIRAYH